MHRTIFSAILLSFIVAACGTPPPPPSLEQMDKSPFTGIPCAAPFWHGLEVGKSTESDVMSVLPTLTFIDHSSLFFHKMSLPTLDESRYAPGVEITANCINSEKPCLTIWLVEDVLSEITISLNYEISADKAIEYLGNPTYVGTQEIGTPTGRSCGVYIIWANSKLVLASILHNKSGVDIFDCDVIYETGQPSSTLAILEVWYLSEATLQRLTSTGTGQFFEFSGTLPEQ